MNPVFFIDPNITQFIPDEMEAVDTSSKKNKPLLHSHLMILNRCSSELIQTPIHLIYYCDQYQFSIKFILQALIQETCLSLSLSIPDFFKDLEKHFNMPMNLSTFITSNDTVFSELQRWFGFHLYLNHERLKESDPMISLADYYQEGVIFLRSHCSLSDIKNHLKK